MFFRFLLFLAFPGLGVQGAMRIVRENSHPDDDFRLPKIPSECPRIEQKYTPSCGKYNAASLGECWCQCGRPSGKYTFYEASYSCVRVSEVRRRAECDLLFTDETVDGLLKIFPASSVGQKTINVPDNQTCSFYFGDKLHAQYLGCAGTWNEIPAQSVNASLEVTPDWSTSRLQMKVKNGATFFQNTTGRLLRVAVQCRHQDASVQPRSTCVVFKVEGRIECPIPQENSSVPSATLPPASPRTTPPEITTRPASEATSEVTKAPRGETTQVNENYGGKTTRSAGNPGVQADAGPQKGNKSYMFIIAGAVVGGIMLIALILLVVWRCKVRKTRYQM